MDINEKDIAQLVQAVISEMNGKAPAAAAKRADKAVP